MNIVEINLGNFGSTGGIMRRISKEAMSRGNTVYVCYPHSNSNIVDNEINTIYIGTKFSRYIEERIAIITGLEEYTNIITTWLFIKKMKKIKPDIIHLHNIHGYFINWSMLLKYITKNQIKTIWTLHDSWAFTGHCPYFVLPLCEKWKNECNNCPRYRKYPMSLWDNSNRLFRLKKKLLSKIPNLTCVQPSKWLTNMVRESFIGIQKHKLKIINNGIDIGTFRPVYSLDNYDLLKPYENIIKDKFLILAVAASWSDSKGLSDFISLSKLLEVDEMIIMVGVDANMIPSTCENILPLQKTNNLKELAYLYTFCNVYCSLSLTETFGLTIIEAQACGTPVVVYNNTAQKELLTPETGFIVDDHDIKAVLSSIREIKKNGKNKYLNSCITYASNYSETNMVNQYLKIYNA